MPRANDAQLNIRSAFARERAFSIARATGMTATQVVEEALRAYSPPAPDPLPPGLVHRGRLIVITGGDRIITAEEAEAAIDAAREERADDCG